VRPPPFAGGTSPVRAPEPLTTAHDVASFDCGNDDLNHWLAQRAMASDGRSARTYVVAVDARVVAYYCLAAGSVVLAALARARLRQNMPDPIPVIVVGRLAVDRRFGRRGFGRGLLKDCVLRSLGIARQIGVRAILVHAVDEEAGSFYRRFGFVESPTDARTLLLPMETAGAVLGI
jgi:GNAT superfamily N-acetyltransferase